VSRVRRGGYIFLSWKSDHPLPHVYLYRERRLVLKWDLDNRRPMKGTASRDVLQLIEQLDAEGLL